MGCTSSRKIQVCLNVFLLSGVPRDTTFWPAMLTFFNGFPERFCDGISRRSFLRAGGLALGGLALSDLLRLRAEGAVAPEGRGKSVIMICLGGGPSHVDTYDMKPGAPAEIRGEFQPIKTN